MHNQRPLCAAPHCNIRNRHHDNCADPSRCWGCLVRPAADGLNLCDVDTRRLVEDAQKIATLHGDLQHALIRVGGHGEYTSGTTVGAPAPNDDVVDLRTRHRAMLLAAVRLICDERGITRPQETYVEQLPAGFIGPPRLRHRTTEALPAAARFIARHGEWLAAHRLAGTIAGRFREAAGDGRAWALAYPAGVDRMYVGVCPMPVTEADGEIGVCGARLYQYPEQPLIGCTGCGRRETIERWRQWLVGDADGQADVYAIAAHLATMWMRPVDPGAVKKWGQRGHVRPVIEVGGDGVERVVRDGKNRTMYRFAECVAYAESLWGPPFQLLSRRAS